MKKVLVVLMCLMMASVIFFGCAPKAEEPAKEEPAATEEQAEEPAKEEAEEPAAEGEDLGSGAAGDPNAEDSVLEGFEPDKCEDTMPYTEIEGKFGPVPEVPEGFKIGCIMNEAVNEYWNTLGTSIKAHAEKLGAQVDIQYMLTAADQAGQLASAEAMASQDYDVYIMSPSTDELLYPVTEQIHAKGKKVINVYVSIIPNADCLVGAIDKDIVDMAIDYIIDLVDGEGKVANVMGTLGSYLVWVRNEYFREAIIAKSEGKIEVIDIPAEWVADNAATMTADTLTTTPDIDAFWCANDTLATGVIEGCRERGVVGEIPIVAMDGTSPALKAIKEGEMTCTFSNSPVFTGELAVELALRAAINDVTLPRVVTGPITTIDASNIDEFVEAM